MICSFAYSGASSEEIVQAAENNEDLSPHSTDSLINAKSYADENGHDSTNIDKELQRRKSEAERKKTEAEIAESDAAKAISELEKAENELNKAKQKLANGEIDVESFAEYEQKVKNAQAVLEQAQQVMKVAYNNLADYCEKYQSSGDPVRNSTGEFLVEYTDFEAQDFLEKFSITRNYSADGFSESFGINWNCSLDSRIVRCVSEPLDEKMALLKDSLNTVQDGLAQIDSYNRQHPSYPKTKLQAYESLFKKYETQIEKTIQILNELKKKNQINEELNQFVSYGRFSKIKNHHSVSDAIVYLDSDGIARYFYYEGGGCWKNPGKLENHKIVIYGLNADGSHSASTSSEGGFEVCYDDGRKKYYSKYGVLQKETDRNKNEILYESEKGFINTIVLKTGEKLFIERDKKNRITKIAGETSGSATFEYESNHLYEVVDNSGLKVTFSYDGENYLTGITKADGGRIKLHCKTDRITNCKVYYAVTDELDRTETFNLNSQKKTMEHKTVSGAVEKFSFNDLGNTVYAKYQNGDEYSFVNNELGLITELTKNKWKTSYSYDDRYRCVKSVSENKVSGAWEYNDFNQITKVTDADGFTQSYEYDDAGNITATYYCGSLISTGTYYPNGLLKSFNENGMSFYYEYNRFGSLIKKSRRYQNGNTEYESWKYDSKNRVTEYKDLDNRITKITYGKNYRCELYPEKLKIERFYDSSNREIKIIQTDTETNVTYIKDIIYDLKGNIKKVFLNGKLYADYDYSSLGKVQSYVVWELAPQQDFPDRFSGIKKTYDYDQYGRVLQVKNQKVFRRIDSDKTEPLENEILLVKNEYSAISNGLKVQSFSYGFYKSVFTYDKNGRLICEEKPDGQKIDYVYSAAGRLISVKDSNKNLATYIYKTDGSYSQTVILPSGAKVFYDFNAGGNLLRIRDFYGTEFTFVYDENENLTAKKNGRYTESMEYDAFGKLIKKTVRDSKGTLFSAQEVDFYGRGVRVREGNYLCGIFSLDAWNRPVKVESKDGIVKYEYDELGNAVKEKLGDGLEVCYEYNSFGNVVCKRVYSPQKNLVSKKDYSYRADGKLVKVISNKEIDVEYTYDDYGNVSSYKDQFSNIAQYYYDSKGLINQIIKPDSGKIRIKYDDSTVSVTDEIGRTWSYILSEGKITGVKNPLGKLQRFTYDKTGNLKTQTNEDSSVRKFFYSPEFKKFVYEDKSEGLIEYENGRITKIENPACSIEYKYDCGGKLIEQKDLILKLDLFFDYDDFGRLVSKNSDLFSEFLEYDKKGRLQKITEKNSGSWVKFNYDYLDHEVLRHYSNGVRIYSDYNSSGKISGTVTKDKIGQTVFSEFYAYDDSGKLRARANHMGDFAVYSYDNSGRLISVVQNYSEDLYKTCEQDYVNCGGYIDSNKNKGERYSIPRSVLNDLCDAAEKLKIQLPLQLSGTSWKTEYTYNSVGSVVSEKSPVGTVIYEYDALNRLINKHSLLTKENGIKYKWSETNSLISEENSYYKKTFINGVYNRPQKIIQTDYATGNTSVTEYEYDLYGRRVLEKSNDNAYRYFYEGNSVEPVMKIPVFNSGRKNLTVTESMDQNLDYRIVKEKYYDSIDSRVKAEDSDIETTEENLPEVYLRYGSEVLYSIKYSSDFPSGAQVSLTFQADLPPVWGKSYNAGYRDYDSSMKSFTSIDPAKDGINYFSYCATDPVNYYDSMGFQKMGYTMEQNARFASAMSDFLLFDKTAYKENGGDLGIALLFDCMDVSTCVNTIGEAETGMKYSSELIEDFAECYYSGDYKGAANSVASKDMLKQTFSDGATKLTSGYDRNYLRSEEDKDSVHYDYVQKEKQKALDALKDPDVIQPGTVLVWQKSQYLVPGDSGNWVGHTVTILARDIDPETGEIIGFAYIEGHTGGGKTEVGYMAIEPDGEHYSVDSWFGDFKGAYELQSTGEYGAGAMREAYWDKYCILK